MLRVPRKGCQDAAGRDGFCSDRQQTSVTVRPLGGHAKCGTSRAPQERAGRVDAAITRTKAPQRGLGGRCELLMLRRGEAGPSVRTVVIDDTRGESVSKQTMAEGANQTCPPLGRSEGLRPKGAYQKTGLVYQEASVGHLWTPMLKDP